jgi:hypothetical protein
MVQPFPYLLLPHFWSSCNRARRRERGDLSRSIAFGGVGLLVCAALYNGASWLTGQLDDYAELGDYLLRLGLSWLFLTFLSFLAFSGVVTALPATVSGTTSTFHLTGDMTSTSGSPSDFDVEVKITVSITGTINVSVPT